MSKRSSKVLVEDMLEALGLIQDFTQGMSFDDFQGDAKTVSAVVRQLEIVGEVARILPPDIREAYPEIPWEKIKGLRNRVIHEYFDVSLSIVWTIITTELKPLEERLNAILSQLD